MRQEVNETKVKTAGALSGAEEERTRLAREVATVSTQLKEEQAQIEHLMVARTELEV